MNQESININIAEREAHLNKANVLIRSFKISYENGDPDGASGSLYYACYHAVKAYFVKCGQDIRRHQKLRTELDSLLKKKNLDKELGINFSRLETLRNQHHYDAIKTVDGKTLEGLVKPAFDLIELMKKLCEEN